MEPRITEGTDLISGAKHIVQYRKYVYKKQIFSFITKLPSTPVNSSFSPFSSLFAFVQGLCSPLVLLHPLVHKFQLPFTFALRSDRCSSGLSGHNIDLVRI